MEVADGFAGGISDQAVEKLQWYALRWKIEVFHKILKSGCRVEASGLRTAERLVRLVAVCCILSWRIFWMTMINRTQPEAAPTVALTQLELDLLDQLSPEKRKTKSVPALGSYLIRIARLGGYLARASDPVPGNIVMWRGPARVHLNPEANKSSEENLKQPVPASEGDWDGKSM